MRSLGTIRARVERLASVCLPSPEPLIIFHEQFRYQRCPACGADLRGPRAARLAAARADRACGAWRTCSRPTDEPDDVSALRRAAAVGGDALCAPWERFAPVSSGWRPSACGVGAVVDHLLEDFGTRCPACGADLEGHAEALALAEARADRARGDGAGVLLDRRVDDVPALPRAAAVAPPR